MQQVSAMLKVSILPTSRQFLSIYLVYNLTTRLRQLYKCSKMPVLKIPNQKPGYNLVWANRATALRTDEDHWFVMSYTFSPFPTDPVVLKMLVVSLVSKVGYCQTLRTVDPDRRCNAEKPPSAKGNPTTSNSQKEKALKSKQVSATADAEVVARRSKPMQAGRDDQ